MVVSHCILLIVFSNSKFSTRRFLANVQPLSGKIVANHRDHHGHTVFRSCPQCLYLSTRMHQPRGRLLGHCLNRSILSLPLFFAVVIFCRLPFHPSCLPAFLLPSPSSSRAIGFSRGAGAKVEVELGEDREGAMESGHECFDVRLCESYSNRAGDCAQISHHNRSP